MVDDEGIIEHLRELEESLKDWQKYRDTINLEELRLNRDKRNMVFHAMLIAIQSTIDIVNHFIVEYGLRKPSTYREAFKILSEGGYVSSKLGDELSDLAGFRNVLVHIYWHLNLEEVFGILQNDFEHLEEFKNWVKKELSK